MFSYGSPYMAEQKQGHQLEPTYSNAVKITGCSPEDLPTFLTTSIRKHANQLKVHEKTVRTAIKQIQTQNVTPWIKL